MEFFFFSGLKTSLLILKRNGNQNIIKIVIHARALIAYDTAQLFRKKMDNIN